MQMQLPEEWEIFWTLALTWSLCYQVAQDEK